MKNILIATDFSKNATHAAEYGYELARHLHTGVFLSNAFIVPAEVPESGTATWPMYEYDELLKDSHHELNRLKKLLEQRTGERVFTPVIRCVAECGTVANVLNEIIEQEEVLLTVMATHSAGALNTLLVGDHAKKMIDGIKGPLLLVPLGSPPSPVKKIAFAIDFREPGEDLKVIFKLVPLLRKLNAELLLTHVCDEPDGGYYFKKGAQNFLAELSNKVDYPHIYYRLVKNSTPERGLDWLCDFGNIDMMVMVHHKRSFLGQMFGRSYSKKVAANIEIPLLIMPEHG